MRTRPTRLPLLVVFSLVASAPSAWSFAYWNETRHSASLSDGRIVVRTENPSGSGASNALLYSTGVVEETAMSAVADGPSTVEAAAPGPTTQRRYYGFRHLHGTEIEVQPVRLADGAAPAPGGLTRIAVDPANDQLFGLTHLDLVDCRVSFDGTRLLAALRNNGGGFPVSSGLTFYGYLLGIADPSDADPDTVFALLYTYNQPGIISPGLYKIFGTGLSDLVKIGDVTATIVASENTLLLSCQLANLYGDPDFASWFDPVERRVSVAGFTQKITLVGGAQEADRTPGGDAYLREFAVDPGANQLPSLQGMQIVGVGANAFVQVTYADADAHCPVLSEVRFDGGASYAMRPQTLDYSGPVVYRSAPGIPPLVGGGWVTAVARFSDNQSDVVQTQLSLTAAPGDRTEGAGLSGAAQPSAWCLPNPSGAEVQFGLRSESAPLRQVLILDARGRLVRVCAPSGADVAANTIRWDGRDAAGRPAPAGCYFWRIEMPGGPLRGALVRVR